MLKLLFIFILTTLLFSCNPAKQLPGNNTLTRDQKNEGWELLFNGKDTRGWHRYGGGSIDSVWKVKDGSLYLDTRNKRENNISGDWDIVTDEEFGNFHFQVEWMISKNGNSGIIFYIHEDKKKHNWPWETGPEMQVLDNEGHRDAKFVKHRSGDLYDIISSKESTDRWVNGTWQR